MKSFVVTLVALAVLAPQIARAEGGYRVEPTMVTDWKTVYGQVEAKDKVPARARLGGTLVELSVSEGDLVEAGQELGRVVDEKIAFQINAIDAQIAALESQMANAERELTRGEELKSRGVITTQQLDALRTQAEVVSQQLEAQRASRQVTEQQATEGAVLAPVAGRVLEVPVAKGAVVMAGESIATIAGGGFFLRLSVPERFAGTMHEGDAIGIETPAGAVTGKLAKIYPLIEGGRVNADVEVSDLNSEFVGARVLVKLPLAMREAILVPAEMVQTHSGLDFVIVNSAQGPLDRAVVPGPVTKVNGTPMMEILSGLTGGEEVLAHEH
ncbi:efflux transporter periplasmic adaptor subunit [Rhodobacter sp. TJ_12]|uniref:efflux RND transporter periplasmic adaptor subunit n=1 Tax=Rhodobacter sp. TJ_12 TaxID=2029399 RepID=UPI001CBAB8BC|nr:efflux RND transporter periplasmic adaptor subunit [Rhodobacter sp. TJ_12]MBZ4023924.1 efflux transporter periplasmic adaptor subunit [Rhodobacter sp. TJ_12]